MNVKIEIDLKPDILTRYYYNILDILMTFFNFKLLTALMIVSLARRLGYTGAFLFYWIIDMKG